jgi:hypothetical protein
MNGRAPRLGDPLPRAAEAYAVPEKLAWILSEGGHGREWARVLRIGAHDSQRFWSAIALAVLRAPIHRIVNRPPYGCVCGVETTLVVGGRTAKALTAWHYKDPHDAPRLVTAYPKV